MFTCHLVVAPLSLCLVHLQILDILTASMETTITWEITLLVIWYRGNKLVSFNRTLVPYEISKVNFCAETNFSCQYVRDLVSPLRFMLRRSSLVECVSVLHGTCLQCAEKKYIHQYVKPCEDWRRLNLSKNPRYTFFTIKSLLRSHIIIIP
jgi:hypothetical protein